jgi:hypothetical protein
VLQVLRLTDSVIMMSYGPGTGSNRLKRMGLIIPVVSFWSPHPRGYTPAGIENTINLSPFPEVDYYQ